MVGPSAEGSQACAPGTTTLLVLGGGLAQPPGFLRTAAATVAAVGSASALAAPALAQEDLASAKATAGTGCRLTRSVFSCSPCATSWPSTSKAPWPRWPRSATPGSSTPGFVGRTVTEFKAALDAAGLRDLGPRPDPPAVRPGRLERASLADANTLGSRFIVHPFFGINFATGEVVRTTAPWRAFASDSNWPAAWPATPG